MCETVISNEKCNENVKKDNAVKVIFTEASRIMIIFASLHTSSSSLYVYFAEQLKFLILS